MTHYYSRESKTHKGQFTIMEVTDKRESLVCRTPRGDIAAHLVTILNNNNLPKKVKKEPLPVGKGLYRTKSWGIVIVLPVGNSTIHGKCLYSVQKWPIDPKDANRIVDLVFTEDFFEREVLEKVG